MDPITLVLVVGFVASIAVLFYFGYKNGTIKLKEFEANLRSSNGTYVGECEFTYYNKGFVKLEVEVTKSKIGEYDFLEVFINGSSVGRAIANDHKYRLNKSSNPILKQDNGELLVDITTIDIKAGDMVSLKANNIEICSGEFKKDD